MTRLANDDHAFVRPSPSAGTLGGVAKATRETMLVMEAAGYDVVLVETVGVGQSEYVVADMVDTFLFLTLARTGDQLQGMKRGILELADVIGVNKSDGAHADDSQKAARELSGALRLLRGDGRRLAGAGHPVQRAARTTTSTGCGSTCSATATGCSEHGDVRRQAPPPARRVDAGDGARSAAGPAGRTRRPRPRSSGPKQPCSTATMTPDQAATEIVQATRRFTG